MHWASVGTVALSQKGSISDLSIRTVAAVHDDETVDVAYDDGDFEARVMREWLRSADHRAK